MRIKELKRRLLREAQFLEQHGQPEKAMHLYLDSSHPDEAARVAIALNRPDQARKIYEQSGDLESAARVIHQFGVRAFRINPPKVLPTGVLTYCGFFPTLDLQVEEAKKPRAVRLASEIEWVPDQLQKIVAKEGLVGIVYDGSPTDIEELSYLNGQEDPTGTGSKYETAWGVYSPSKKLFAARPEHGVPLHEYCHAVDHLVGEAMFGCWLSDTKEIQEEFVRLKDWLPEDCYNPREFMVHVMRDYFHSMSLGGNNIDILRRKFPNTINLLEYVEDHFAIR